MVEDPKGRLTPGYQRHMFICAHERGPEAKRPCCLTRGGMDLMKRLKNAAKQEGLSGVRVQKSGCLDFCENGISCVVYPEGVWYTLTGEENIPDLLEHIRSGTVAEHLRMNLEE